MAEGPRADFSGLPGHREFSPRRVVWVDGADAACQQLDRGQSCRRLWSGRRCRAQALLFDCFGLSQRTAILPAPGQRSAAGGDYDRLAEKTTEVKRMLTGLVQKLKAV